VAQQKMSIAVKKFERAKSKIVEETKAVFKFGQKDRGNGKLFLLIIAWCGLRGSGMNFIE
jgi:hypothetical protein